MSAHVLSIAPGLPFLRTLAEAVLDGRVLRGAVAPDDPLALAAITLFVPTRRAARSLGTEFARALGGRSAILPAIRTIGDDEDAALFDAGSTGLEPVMSPLERRMLIARFVRQWKAGLNTQALELLAGEAVVLPASAADALWLAGDLATLLDETTNEAATLSGLVDLAPERLAGWWQLTLTFLQILTKFWPEVLAERGAMDAAAARNLFLERAAERYRSLGSAGPVIVAGSTATAPATLALMRAVAQMENGALVLPGLDRHLEPRGFDAIDIARAPGRSGTAPGHPQFGLKKILAGLLIPREVVEHIAPPENSAATAREAFVADALRPAETTDAWGEGTARHPPEALDGLALVEAVDEREEALAIAIAMRDALSAPEATVALTTPDRSLARRVVAELKRFGIEANDSAGRPLAATAPGTLLTLAVEAALTPGDPIVLVGLLKHPLLRLGLLPGEARRAARAIETLSLRGTVGIADAARLAAIFAEARAAAEDAATRAPPRPVRLVPAADRDLAVTLSARLETALLPLTALRPAPPATVDIFARAVTEVLEALAAGPDGDASELYREEAGAALATFLAGLLACPDTGFAFASSELSDVMTALMAGETVRPRGGLSARAFVWGTLEARLQSVDTMVLGGLNEGSWPARAGSDAFLSRLMRAEIALDPPERRIGLAAHDFTQALGASRVVMTRAQRVGGAPAIASRWLQRLTTLAGEAGTARLRQAGAAFLGHARRLDQLPEVPRSPRPAPRPPLADRPGKYSVTEVETLIRDPYAIHAKKILRLEPMPELMRDPGAADRGNLYHAVLAGFVTDGIDPADPDAEEKLLTLAREKFDAEQLPAEVEAIWWPRMETLAANYVAWERARGTRVVRRFEEARGSWRFEDLDTVLSGYADRIDVMEDGSVEIIDFKTGTSPSVKQARTLLAPQLPLEGAMVRLGAFAVTKGPVVSISDLLYVRLRERELYDETLTHLDKKTGVETTGDRLSDAALVKFRQLVAAYRDPGQPFVSRPRPFLAGDYSGAYDHLARAREWSVGDDSGEETE
ncbi:double-strand break repair protein AddB [Aureimonas glaciei]|uniref:double-strand break repair protein AddB n=1 Tax=Aureimonas glaciei TaxID=1776957 RepID=UPI00166480F2|nr:double-strand break repair protein AddB [Aureimonas glaciei]